MALRRSTLLLLGAIVALLGLPAFALAQAPPTNQTVPTPGGWLNAPYDVTLVGNDPDGGPVTMEWQINSGPVTSEANNTLITIPGSGTFDFKTRAVDGEPLDSGWRSETLRIDTILPTDATDPGGTGWRMVPATVSVIAADATSGLNRVEWQLDGGLIQSGPSGSNVPINGDGVHTLRTRAVDNATNQSAWRDHTIRIDTVIPNDTTAVPSGWQTAPLPVSVTGTDAHSGVASASWRVDGGLITSAAAPGAFTVSAEGVHTIETRVTDVAGNMSAWSAPRTVRVDTTAPTNSTVASDGEWTTADYNVLVTAADATSGLAEVQYRINAGPWIPGPSGTQATVAGSGDHTFETRAVDVAGNISVPRLDHVRIDRIVPTNTTPAPAAGPHMNGYTVAVSGTDSPSGVDRVEWRVNGGAIQSGPSGTNVTITTHRTDNKLETRVVDEAGNASAWREDTVNVDMYTQDVTDPVDTTTPADPTWQPGAIDVTISGTDAGSGVARLLWRVDGLPVQSVSASSATIRFDTEGTHTLETMVRDAKGNETDWRSQDFKVDLTVPANTTTIAVGATGWATTRNFTLTATDATSGINEIEYRITRNGVAGALQHGTNNQTITLPADDTYTVWTRAIDNARHASLPRTQTLNVDSIVPVNTSAVPAGGWITTPFSLALSGTDGGSGFDKMQWRIGATGDIHDGGPAEITEDGVHTLQTRAVDAAGNVSVWRDNTVSIDTTKPTNTTPAAPTAWRKTPYTVVVAGEDGTGSGVDRIERKIDGGVVSNDPNVTITGDGTHTLSTRIADEAGLFSDWRDETIKIDTAAPQAALSCSSGADVWSRVPVTCSVTADGGLSGLGSATVAGADGGTAAAVNGTVATVSADGGHTVRLDVVDGAGNAAAATATVYVDRTAPAAGLTCAAADGKYTCTADASDGGSGLATLGWSLDGGAFEPIAAGAAFTVTKGKVRLRAVDAAGNETITDIVTLAAIPAGAKVRISNVPVYLAGRDDAKSMLGALNAVRSATGTVSLDLRPLAVGRGNYRVEIRLKSGKHSKKVKRTYKVGRTGALPRMSASLSDAVEKTTITLTVRKQVGKSWRKHAGTRLVLAK